MNRTQFAVFQPVVLVRYILIGFILLKQQENMSHYWSFSRKQASDPKNYDANKTIC